MFDAQIFDWSFLLEEVSNGEWRADTKVNAVLYSLVQGSSRSITGKGAAKMPSLECIYFIYVVIVFPCTNVHVVDMQISFI